MPAPGIDVLVNETERKQQLAERPKEQQPQRNVGIEEELMHECRRVIDDKQQHYRRSEQQHKSQRKRQTAPHALLFKVP